MRRGAGRPCGEVISRMEERVSGERERGNEAQQGQCITFRKWLGKKEVEKWSIA